MGGLAWRRSLHLLHRFSLGRPLNSSALLAAEDLRGAASSSSWVYPAAVGSGVYSPSRNLWTAAGGNLRVSDAEFACSTRARVIGLGFGNQGSRLSSLEERRRRFHGSGVQRMAQQKKDFYEILGLQSGATQKEIKTAYYSLAKAYHPDVNKENPSAEKQFQEVQQAYEVLKDDEKRAMYDQLGHDAYQQAAAGGAPASGGFEGFSETIFGDMFSGGVDEMFRQAFGGDQQGGGRRHVQVTLSLTFMESAQGCSKKVSFPTSVRCHSCHGTGLPPGVEPQPCKACRGKGRQVMQQGFFTFESTCSSCGGSGHSVKDRCRTCKGQGTVKGTREVDVTIPAGVETGTVLQMRGEGGQGSRGIRPGNLHIQIQVMNHPVFRREGADVHVDATVSVVQAILGGQVQVPTLAGDVVLKLRAGTQPGQKQVLRGKGIKVLNSKHYGDQYVHINVVIPVSINQHQQSLIEEFGRYESTEAAAADQAAEGSG
ncbi:unnamed protein product [Sphagnum troendelagicum]